jgi:hypothetical protein
MRNETDGEVFSLRTKNVQHPLRFLSIRRLVLIATLISKSLEITNLEVSDQRK